MTKTDLTPSAVTQADHDAAQAYIDDPRHCTAGMQPTARQIMNEHFSRHRIAAFDAGAKAMQEAADEVCRQYEAFCGEKPLWPDEPRTSISLIEPKSLRGEA